MNGSWKAAEIKMIKLVIKIFIFISRMGEENCVHLQYEQHEQTVFLSIGKIQISNTEVMVQVFLIRFYL